MQMLFKHLDLREIEGRLDPEKRPSARGKMYWDTEPGRADVAFRSVAYVLKDFWAVNPAKVVRISEIESDARLPQPSIAPRIPAALKRLARMQQVKLDFDRDGVLISPGSAWIET